MKIGKIAAVFAAAAMVISVILGYTLPLVQNILVNDETKQIIITDENFIVSLKKDDYLYFGNYLDEPILWKVLDVKDGKPLMMTEYIICFKAFDANGKNTDYHTGTDTEKYGSSDWDDCTLKEWLNSSEKPVVYSHCPPDAGSVYRGCNAYTEESGFLSEKNFDSHLKRLISQEGIFLLTTNELRKYFTDETRRKTCTESAILHNDSPYLLTASRKIWYWTSSPVSSNNVSVAAVTSSGGFYKTLAYDSVMGVSPSLRLNETAVCVCRGDGSKGQPYVVI